MLLEDKLSKFGSILGLERIEKLLNKWGNPQKKIIVTIVTGTNGKGSTTAYLASILREAGYKVGSYFSPHLKSYTERIKINGKKISDSDLEKYSKEIIEWVEEGNTLTLFEALTAIAYRHFAEEKCDYAVMEVGMGGRFDAVNIATEKISIITNIGLEHTETLGNTEEKIAFEKAGVIKQGIAITGAKGNALKVIKKEAGKRAKGLLILGEDFEIKNILATSEGTSFEYLGKNSYTTLELQMLGKYQAENAALAIRAAEELGIKENHIRNGLKNARIKGRMEIISSRPITQDSRPSGPMILVDGAHNLPGVESLIENLKLFNYSNLILVFGVMKDKNWKGMILKLSKRANKIILNKTTSQGERVLEPKIIEEFLKKNNFKGEIKIIEDVGGSLKYAKSIATKKDLVLVCGSIYMISESL